MLMNCVKFQDSLSDYLEGALDPRARAEGAAHRLICGECRELYNDVRGAVQALGALRSCDDEPEGLRSRIIAHTTPGEMLSCGEFDRLLERYFDGVILAPTFQTFQSHFEQCLKCRRLLNGIEEAIVMLQDAKEAEVEVPGSLHDRIVAATIGKEHPAWAGWIGRAQSSIINFAQRLLPPQMAVAAMIIALISLLIISRFGSVRNLTTTAEQKVESLVNQGHQKINGAGAMARSGFQRVSYGVNTFLFSGAANAPTVPTSSSGPAPAQNTPQSQRSDHAPDSTSSGASSENRERHQKRPNRTER
jgi:type II secretory pathway pseudopilin PulG